MAIITISRGTMGLATALAEKLAARLGVKCLGREVVREAAEKLGVSHEIMQKKIQEAPAFLERWVSERKPYVLAMQAVLADYASCGDLVYHGHAGHLLLRSVPAVLKARIIAPLEARIPLAMEHEHLGREEARAYIQKVDEARAKWAKFLYGVDWGDPQLYDIVLNMSGTTIDTASDVLALMAKRPEFAITPEVSKKLADFALASKVKLELALNPATRGLELEVQADNGEITISGAVPQASLPFRVDARFEEELRAVTLGVRGVKAVAFALSSRPGGIVD